MFTLEEVTSFFLFRKNHFIFPSPYGEKQIISSFEEYITYPLSEYKEIRQVFI